MTSLAKFLTTNYKGPLLLRNETLVFSKEQHAEEAQAIRRKEQAAGVIEIASSSDFPCYQFQERNSPRAFRAPAFHQSGQGWPTLSRGKVKIEALKNAAVYVLSLAEAKPRREHFAKQWASLDLDLPVQWVEGVDGSSPEGATPFHHEVVGESGVQFSGIAGCWETHAGLLSSVSSDVAIVFEDDVEFLPNFTAKLAEILASVPDDWDHLHLGSAELWDPPYAELPGAWIRARSASGTWGYVLRKRAVSKFLHANAVTLDLRAVDTFYGGLGYACDSRFHVNTYLPPQPLVGCASLLSITQIPDATTKTKLEAEHVWQNGDLPIPFRTTWSPQFCRTHVGSGSWSWSDWCRQRCLTDESWSCALQPRRRSGAMHD
jgi:GR25 family glycosyltransferase involved in LPS biosynthesis